MQQIEQQKIRDTEYQIKARKAEPTQVHKEQKMSHGLSKTTWWSQDAYASGISNKEEGSKCLISFTMTCVLVCYILPTMHNIH